MNLASPRGLGFARQQLWCRGSKSFSSSPQSKTSEGHWLQRILSDTSAAPKLYAWKAANLQPDHVHASVQRPLESDSEGRQKPRIHVLGVGNLGRLFATSLAKSPSAPPITLILHRKALLEHWVAEPGIEITRAGQVERFSNFDVEWWTEETPSTGPINEATGITNLIVATKASDALPQVDRLRRYLTRGSTVAFTQNGMCKMWPPLGDAYNNHRFSQYDAPNWLACVTTHGVVSVAPFRSIHASVASATIGQVLVNPTQGDKSQYLINRFVDSPDLRATQVTKPDLWILQLEKLVVNSIINPLTAILRCKNGDLFEPQDDELPLVIERLIREASKVLRRLVAHSSSNEILDTAEDPAVQNKDATTKEELIGRFSHENLHRMVYDVGYKVRENTSSMLQDVRAGKRTEILDFNGWLVDTARFLDDDLQMPAHTELIRLIETGVRIPRSQLSDHFDLAPETLG